MADTKGRNYSECTLKHSILKNEDPRPWSPDRPESRRMKPGSTLGGTRSYMIWTDRHLGRSAKPLEHSEGRDAGPKEALALWPIPKGETIHAANKSPKHSSCAACSGRPFGWCPGTVLPLLCPWFSERCCLWLLSKTNRECKGSIPAPALLRRAERQKDPGPGSFPSGPRARQNCSMMPWRKHWAGQKRSPCVRLHLL